MAQQGHGGAVDGEGAVEGLREAVGLAGEHGHAVGAGQRLEVGLHEVDGVRARRRRPTGRP